MDELSEIVNSLVHGAAAEPMAPAETEARAALLAKLFEYYHEADVDRLDLYVHETAEIPFDKLALGIKVILRQRPWPDLPRLADLWLAARTVAGMHLNQYRAGQYLSPPTTWPPRGKRHGIHAHSFEQLDIRSVPAIGPGGDAPEALRAGKVAV